MIIDSHTHIGKFKDWNISIDKLYGEMLKNKIDQAVVSNIAGNEFDYEHIRINEYTDVEVNTRTLGEIKRYENAFKMLAWIRPYSGQDISDMEHFIKRNRNYVVGIKVQPFTANVPLFDKRYDKYLSLCREYKLPFCVHTENDGYSNIEYVDKLAKENVDINFMAVHMGLNTNHEEAIRCILDNQNVYGDTTMVNIEDILNILNYGCEDKILFGSDAAVFGSDSYNRYSNFEKEIESNFGKRVANKIFYENCIKFFGLEESWIKN